MNLKLETGEKDFLIITRRDYCKKMNKRLLSWEDFFIELCKREEIREK